MEQEYLDDFEDDLQQESEKIKDAVEIVHSDEKEEIIQAAVEKPKKAKKENIKIEPVDKPVAVKSVESAMKPEPKKTKKVTPKPPIDNIWDDDDQESIWSNISTWRTLTVIVAVLLLFSVYTGGFQFTDTPSDQSFLSSSEVGTKVIGFLNTNVLQPPFTASVQDSAEESGLYKLTLSVAGQEVQSYVSKDGALLFPQGIDLNNAPTATFPEIIERIEVSSDNDAFIGEAAVPVVMVEFGDFEDASSGKFAREVLPILKEKYIDTGKLKFVFRDFPLNDLHPSAELAGVASECAYEQGSHHFWVFHDRMFADQSNLNVDTFKSWAEELNFNLERFDNCMANMRYIGELQEDISDGRVVGVTGTPTFFINGRMVTGAQPLSVFENIIEDELRITGGVPQEPGAASPVNVIRDGDEDGLEGLGNLPSVEVEAPVVEVPSIEVSEASVVEKQLQARKWRFLPNQLTVNQGDSVELTITSDFDFTFGISDLGVSQPVSGVTTVSFDASQSGEFEFSCSDCDSFRGMTGTLVVK